MHKIILVLWSQVCSEEIVAALLKAILTRVAFLFLWRIIAYRFMEKNNGRLSSFDYWS
jgi:uncharacterized protein (DUF2062 family)